MLVPLWLSTKQLLELELLLTLEHRSTVGTVCGFHQVVAPVCSSHLKACWVMEVCRHPHAFFLATHSGLFWCCVKHCLCVPAHAGMQWNHVFFVCYLCLDLWVVAPLLCLTPLPPKILIQWFSFVKFRSLEQNLVEAPLVSCCYSNCLLKMFFFWMDIVQWKKSKKKNILFVQSNFEI